MFRKILVTLVFVLLVACKGNESATAVRGPGFVGTQPDGTPGDLKGWWGAVAFLTELVDPLGGPKQFENSASFQEGNLTLKSSGVVIPAFAIGDLVEPAALIAEDGDLGYGPFVPESKKDNPIQTIAALALGNNNGILINMDKARHYSFAVYTKTTLENISATYSYDIQKGKVTFTAGVYSAECVAAYNENKTFLSYCHSLVELGLKISGATVETLASRAVKLGTPENGHGD